MLRAIEWVRAAPDTGQLGGIGLWYPSPSEYDPLAFLASLSDGFGTEIDQWYRRHPLVRRRDAIRRTVLLLVVAVVAVAVIWWLARRDPIDDVAWQAPALACLVTVALLGARYVRLDYFSQFAPLWVFIAYVVIGRHDRSTARSFALAAIAVTAAVPRP